MDIDIKIELMFLFSAHIVSSLPWCIIAIFAPLHLVGFDPKCVGEMLAVLLQLKGCQEPSHPFAVRVLINSKKLAFG